MRGMVIPSALEVLEDSDELLAVGRGHAAALLQDGLELAVRNVVHVQFDESIPERTRQHLTTAVEPGRVLGGEEHEVRVGLDHLLRLRNEKLVIVVQQAIERLQHLRRRQVELVQHHPVALNIYHKRNNHCVRNDWNVNECERRGKGIRWNVPCVRPRPGCPPGRPACRWGRRCRCRGTPGGRCARGC